MPVLTEAQFRVTLVIDGQAAQYYFTTKSGGEWSKESQKYPLGDRSEMKSIQGIPQVSDLTLGAPFDPEVHDDLSVALQKRCTELIQIVVESIRICPTEEVVGKRYTYQDCDPVGFTPPQVNRGGSAPATWEATFSAARLVIA